MRPTNAYIIPFFCGTKLYGTPIKWVHNSMRTLNYIACAYSMAIKRMQSWRCVTILYTPQATCMRIVLVSFFFTVNCSSACAHRRNCRRKFLSFEFSLLILCDSCSMRSRWWLHCTHHTPHTDTHTHMHIVRALFHSTEHMHREQVSSV